MDQLLRRLEQLGLGLSDEDIADAVWLAMQIGPAVTAVEIPDEPSEAAETELSGESETDRSNPSVTDQSIPKAAPQRQSPAVSAFASDSVSRPPESETATEGVPFQAPGVTALPNALDLGRSLRPLMRKVPSATQFVLDSEATVNRVIEQQIWQPVLLPAPERWLDLEMVVEESPFSLVWQQTLAELKQKVLERSGVFRDVRSWTLRNQDGKPQLISRYAGEVGSRVGQPQELVHPSGRRLVMVISDGQSELWQNSQLQPDSNTLQSEQPAPNLHAWLHYWASHGPTVMVQLLPKWMWEQSALEFGIPAQLMSIFPGAANQLWETLGLSARQRRRADEDPVLKIPVVILEAESLQTWATVVAAAGIAPTPGFVFNLNDLKQYQQAAQQTPSRLAEISDEALIDRFLATASVTAQQLAGLMAAVPVSMPVIHLLQAHFLPKSTPVHVAEVFMGGLLQPTGINQKTQQPVYDFKTKEVRRLLNQAFPTYKTHQVVKVLSEAIAKKLGRDDLNSFAAFLSLDPAVLELGDTDQERIVQRFAELLPEVLRNLGGAYATLADTAELLARQPRSFEAEAETETSEFSFEFPGIPELEDFEYVTPVIQFEDDHPSDRTNDIGLISEVKTVEVAMITISRLIGISISRDEAHEALEQNLPEIKQRIIQNFKDKDLEFRVNRLPEDDQSENVDEREIALSNTQEPYIEILHTSLETVNENVASFQLLVRIGFTVEMDFLSWDSYISDNQEDTSYNKIEWAGRWADGRVQVSLSFSEVDLSAAKIDSVELEVDNPIWLTDPNRSPSASSDTSDYRSLDRLEPFEFQIKTIVESAGRWMTLIDTGTAYRFVEPLAEGINLEMVAIPGGEFAMGSPEDEPERFPRESLHHVTVPGFCMGRYPITQVQWRVVAGLPKVNRDLKTDPSRFKGDDRPVEQVRWYEAVEFCQRLSRYTGREYRLPSEAEWEYACRAGTTTPFHFGAMITTEVANYNGSTYARGPIGKRRGKTTSVTEFGIANAFGLSDMHGNVSEWCLDHSHDNYEGAPTDGSAWLSENEKAPRVRRGGSWNAYPRLCRSASRYFNNPDIQFTSLGFRVVIAPRGSP